MEPGDVVLAMDRPWIPAGLKVAQVTETDTPSYLVQRVARLRTTSREDRSFLFALLSTTDFESYIQNATTGTAVPHISAKQILDYKFNLPPATVRTGIGALAAALNDRITLLRETNATLEAIAQALFKSWFVDFDPVRAKMEGRAPEGMDEATAALFPDALEESELGEVPRGWLPVRLNSFLELAYGKALKAENRNPGPVPVYGSGGITGWHDTPLIDSPSIIVGRKGTVGSLYWESRPFYPIDTVFYVKSKCPLTYCHQLLKTVGLHDMNTDAAVPGLNRENVYRLLVPDAPANVLAAFDASANALRNSIDQNEAQAQTLSTLRDTLLPHLISGQLRLPESQAAMKDAL
ncbi:restriction endonuclease subunit S [Acidovorax sp.]|uniref:restriction endonuclease subunit S n=1 Tax=Acidovorax sp. TaxID=1872122 RepID=UPI00391D3C90